MDLVYNGIDMFFSEWAKHLWEWASIMSSWIPRPVTNHKGTNLSGIATRPMMLCGLWFLSSLSDISCYMSLHRFYKLRNCRLVDGERCALDGKDVYWTGKDVFDGNFRVEQICHARLFFNKVKPCRFDKL